MSKYVVIRTVDILDDEEFLVIPEPSWQELDEADKAYPIDKYGSCVPFWFDSDLGWNWTDFSNTDIYKSVEMIQVSF
jgi:hypothetical protein